MSIKNFLDGGASEAQKKNEANAAWLKQQFGADSGLGQGMLLQALAGLDKGYANAQGYLDKSGETATNQIMQQGAQALAAGQQSLMDSGLNGTIAAQLPGQVAAQTNQALAGLSENIGAQKAGLAMGHAQSKMAGSQSFANWVLNKTQTASNITPQYKAEGGGFLGGLGELAGKAALAYATGGLSLAAEGASSAASDK